MKKPVNLIVGGKYLTADKNPCTLLGIHPLNQDCYVVQIDGLNSLDIVSEVYSIPLTIEKLKSMGLKPVVFSVGNEYAYKISPHSTITFRYNSKEKTLTHGWHRPKVVVDSVAELEALLKLFKCGVIKEN